MTNKYTPVALATVADVHTAAPLVRKEIDRSFRLPTRLYGATVGLYLAYIAVMAAGFQSRELILPMAIFAFTIVAAFGVPAMWTRMKPEHRAHAIEWTQFRLHGIDTLTGRTEPRDAVVQVLILPALILAWGLIVVTIAALV